MDVDSYTGAGSSSSANASRGTGTFAKVWRRLRVKETPVAGQGIGCEIYSQC